MWEGGVSSTGKYSSLLCIMSLHGNSFPLPPSNLRAATHARYLSQESKTQIKRCIFNSTVFPAGGHREMSSILADHE
jgi:hypothetical protein